MKGILQVCISHFIANIPLNVDPPEVSLHGVSGPIEEGSLLVINCTIQEGNPQNTTTRYWEFEPRYPGAKAQALPEQGLSRELRVDKAVYSDAGTYGCTAVNAVGTDTEEIQIIIHCEY